VSAPTLATVPDLLASGGLRVGNLKGLLSPKLYNEAALQ
jgi:hypothetical protein